jgi:CHAT domain-containing protein
MLVMLVAGSTSAIAQSAQASAKQTQPNAQQTQPSAQQTQSLNLSAYAELLRSDVRAQKVAIITEVMNFTDQEDAAFWPIYREYDLEMAKLGDERVALISEYADNYSKLTDAVAEKLAAKALDLEARRQATKAKCYERVKGALPARTALRFLQVEHQLLLLIDLQISAALPIVKSTTE